MCLALPMKIKQVKGEFAEVETGKLTRKVNIAMLRDVTVGDYVLVHAGFAIEKIEPKKAKETLRLIHEIR